MSLNLSFFIKSIRHIIKSILCIVLCCVNLSAQALDSKQESPHTQSSTKETQHTQSHATKHYHLNAITTTFTTNSHLKTYQSGSTINTQLLESHPSGNGDITSVLRILPNVQYDNAQLRSTTPGEIDPANISISGGLFYQNNFMLDGLNMNNDLDPAGTGSWTGNAPGRSQGLAIDTSLLESITVQDSNISAAYGGFTGGVIEANTRRPTKKFGANISYQITQGNAHSDAFSMTNYHLYDESTRDSFLESYDDSNQPHFIKHLVRAQVESQLHDTFGLIAAFSMTQSIIPLRRSNNDHLGSWATPVDPNDQGSATRNQTRQIYNYFLKTYYDPSENVRLELTYTYAPQYDYRFIVGTKDDEYHFDSGGHQLGLKTTWDNGLGTLTHVLGYSFLENSVTTNFHATKYWQASDSKHWSNWATWVRSGGYAPSQSIQHTLGNKLIQDFTPFEFIGTQHVFQAGLEINYQHASFGFSKPYDSAVKTSTFMTQAQQALCAQTNGEWCDTAKAYDPRGFEKLDGVNVVANPHGVGAIWNYGQYFHTITRFVSDRTIALHDVAFAVFFQDDMQIPLGKLGSLNIRAGVRLDTDSYMGKFTAGHRLSLNYEAPWNAGDTGRNFATQLTTGVNRYYGRNLFAYRLADGRNTLKTDIRRNSPDKTWEEVLAEGRICTPRYRDPQTNEWIYDSNCRETYANSVKFESLKVPYVDEFLVGYAQHLYDWNGGIKYIYRAGRDEIRYVRSDYVGLPTDSHYASTYYTYTNEGKSWIHVVTLVIENHKPIEFWGMKHFVLFAFDWNGVKRNFNDYASSATLHQIQDNEIVWEGQVVPYSQRPASNFMRPYTLRLTTTHTFNIGRTKWLWHNFFRYRSDYDAMARIHIAGRQYIGNLAGREHAQYDPAHNDKDQYIAQRIRKAFTWDMRIGFEVTLGKGNILYMNMDIYNVLDAQNPTILTANYAGDSSAPTIGYEVGRQFWIQVGWKL